MTETNCIRMCFIYVWGMLFFNVLLKLNESYQWKVANTSNTLTSAKNVNHLLLTSK